MDFLNESSGIFPKIMLTPEWLDTKRCDEKHSIGRVRHMP